VTDALTLMDVWQLVAPAAMGVAVWYLRRTADEIRSLVRSVDRHEEKIAALEREVGRLSAFREEDVLRCSSAERRLAVVEAMTGGHNHRAESR